MLDPTSPGHRHVGESREREAVVVGEHAEVTRGDLQRQHLDR